VKKLLFVFIASVFILACSKNSSQKNTEDEKYSSGVITGRDLTKCYCCWGWIIEIDNTTYKFDNIPPATTFDLATITYPATVKIKWRPSQTRLCSEFIDILDISNP
jgi:hypothetical protein